MSYKKEWLSSDSKIDLYSSSIYYFINYYRSNDVRGLNEDDKRLINSKRLLDFKDGNNNNYYYFEKCLSSHYDDLGDGEWIVCSIPGHDQITNSPNHMDRFLKSIFLPINIKSVPGLIIRKQIMPKKHGDDYGDKTVERDLESYKFGVNMDLRGKNVLILDDIVTTGTSLVAARYFLRKCGANKIVCLAFGRTAFLYGQ